MDLSPITDLFTNIKEKISNPFFGTLIIVSIARNWDLIYSLFNFSNKSSRIYKIQYIRNYLADKNIFQEAGINILWTIGIVIVGYFFVVVFRTLSIWIEFNLMLDLTKVAASDKIVFKEEYTALKEDRDEYAERYEDQRKRVREYSKINDELTRKEQSKNEEIVQHLEIIESLKAKINEHDTKINEKLRTIENLQLDLDRQHHAYSQLEANYETDTADLKTQIEITRSDYDEIAQQKINYMEQRFKDILRKHGIDENTPI